MFMRKAIKFLALGAIGAGAAYYFDPKMGRTRRARLADQANALLGQMKETAKERAAYESGRLEGLKHKMGSETAPENDQTLVAKVESEVLGRWGHLKGRVDVNATDRVVDLRGTTDSEDEIISLERDVRKVSGVIDVHNYLHLPGTEAPNKAEALHAHR